MKISLIGYMGSGKTTIGKILSDELGVSFKDLDDEIEFLEHMIVQDIFNNKGELYFRKKENEVLRRVLSSGDNMVLSTGGGTVAFYDNMDFINKNSVSFYLSLSPISLSERLKLEKNSRPLIKHLDDSSLTEFVAKHLFERNVFYQKSMYSIFCDRLSENEIVENILNKVKIHQNQS